MYEPNGCIDPLTGQSCREIEWLVRAGTSHPTIAERVDI